MLITKNLLTTKVTGTAIPLWLYGLPLHVSKHLLFVAWPSNTIFRDQSCSYGAVAYVFAELNCKSMDRWHQFPNVAFFPGCMLLGDDRPDDSKYPSESFTPQQLSAQEPALATSACRSCARLYTQEGMPCCVPCASFVHDGVRHQAQGAKICCTYTAQHSPKHQIPSRPTPFCPGCT